MSQKKALNLIAYITVQAGEYSYPMWRVIQVDTRLVDIALNAINEDLKEEFLNSDTPVQYALHENDDVPEWKKGFWQGGEHTIRITRYKEITEDEFNVLVKF